MMPDRYEARVIEDGETISAGGVIENVGAGIVLRGNGENPLLFAAVDLDERASNFRMKAYKQTKLGFVVVLLGIGSGMATVL